METNIKTAGWSTKGWIVFVTSENKYFCINSKDVIDKENCNNDLYSYIVNCMKVFTPAKIEHNSKVIHIKLTAENKNISANRLELPSDYHDALNVKEVVE